MATRSTIALEFADGTVQQVYCHWDGYLENNGQILRDNYSDPFKLADLIAEGDMSSLKDEVSECEFYSARGEDCPARKFASLSDYYNNCQDEEYDYILTMRYGWRVRCYSTDGAWVDLKEAFEREAAAEAE